MKLTPISVPGKRRRAGEPPRSRRVFKRAKKTATPQVLVTAASARTRRGKASYLEERLPLEILQSIFMYSENINFVRASPLIGKFLSEIETRREVFVYAFAPTWCANSMLGDSKLDREANPDFQSMLLEYSWANMRFIIQCFEQCGRLFGKLMEGRDIFGDLDLEFDDDGNSIVTDDADKMSAEQYFMNHFASFISKDRVVDKALLTRSMSDQITMVHHNTRIPDAIITGPWDEESLKKFYWLVRAGASYQEDQTWELSFKGLETALEHYEERDGYSLSALLLLKHTMAYLDWPAGKLDEVHELIYPLELKAAYMKKHSVFNVLSSVRIQIETLAARVASANSQAAAAAENAQGQ